MTENLSNHTPPDDPAALRAEIAQTREELADTVEQLTSKADVPARVRSTVHEGVESAKDTVATATHQAAEVAATAAGQVRGGLESLRDSVHEGDLRKIARPVPLSVLLGAAAAVGAVIYLATRRRR